MKKIGALVAIAIFSIWGYQRFQHNRPQIEEFFNNTWSTPVTAADKPKVSAIDDSVFSALNEKLTRACADNRYDMTEAMCIQTIADRKDMCQQWTVQKYQELAPSVERLEMAISSHTDCVFQWAPASPSI